MMASWVCRIFDGAQIRKGKIATHLKWYMQECVGYGHRLRGYSLVITVRWLLISPNNVGWMTEPPWPPPAQPTTLCTRPTERLRTGTLLFIIPPYISIIHTWIQRHPYMRTMGNAVTVWVPSIHASIYFFSGNEWMNQRMAFPFLYLLPSDQ